MDAGNHEESAALARPGPGRSGNFEKSPKCRPVPAGRHRVLLRRGDGPAIGLCRRGPQSRRQLSRRLGAAAPKRARPGQSPVSHLPRGGRPHDRPGRVEGLPRGHGQDQPGLANDRLRRSQAQLHQSGRGQIRHEGTGIQRERRPPLLGSHEDDVRRGVRDEITTPAPAALNLRAGRHAREPGNPGFIPWLTKMRLVLINT